MGEFLNNAEKSAIRQLIIQNYIENHGYSGAGELPNGNLLCWEMQIICCNWNDKTISKDHIENWYAPAIHHAIETIKGSKKL
jgi:hypothetical protein